MKLSDMEKLVAAMRASATKDGLDDIEVRFWDFDFSKRDPERAFMDLDIHCDAVANLKHHKVIADYGTEKYGDYTLPLECV